MINSNILRFSIIKTISRETKIKIEHQLKSIDKSKTKALLLDISSNQGSLNQAIEIANMFKMFKKENPNIHFYTFGEDQILGPGIVILTSGDKVFADKNSCFGCYDFIKRGNSYKQYLYDNKININMHTAGEHKLRLNPFESVKEKDVIWINNILAGLKKILVDSVYENRKHLIKNKDRFSQLFNSTVYFGDKAFEEKLIDDFGTIDTVAINEFPDIPLKKAKAKVTIKQLLEHYKNNNINFLSKD